jgi:RimJ/RimL family protein N-acetyltransferase
LQKLQELHNDQDIWGNLFNIDFVDSNSQEAWWKSLSNKKHDLRYVICFEDNPDEIIGRLRIQNINHQHNNCEVGLDIIKEYRGKGFGFISYQMLLQFLFDEFNMNMVYLRVADFNPGARKLYEKVGFRETGKFPKFFFRKGQFWDYILMSLLREDYNELRNS